MKHRVVITGMGVVAPNAVGLDNFLEAIQQGTSGIKFHQELEDLKFSCCIAGTPNITEEQKNKYLTPLQLRGFNSAGILYGCIAGMDAWQDAGFTIDRSSTIDYNTGIIFGTGTSGVDKFREAIYKLDNQKVRQLGSTTVIQTMASGISAYLGGILGIGNQVTTNSSACNTGTESLLMGFERVKSGKATRMIVGSCSDKGPYIWGGFDAMRVMTYKHNKNPEKGSQPMSANASGFVPGSGAGALVLESLESALKRKSTIYAEVMGGNINCGGQRDGGTMTAPNSNAVQKCITDALVDSKISPSQIDAINGHLTSTTKDPVEIENWVTALGRSGQEFPMINSLKSMVGHCIAASGSIEIVATVLQLKHQFLFPNINCVKVHPEILKLIPKEKIPMRAIKKNIKFIAKASFGFGDVNGCVIFKKY